MFKKTLIAAAALTAFSTAAIAADASGEIYGDFRYSLNQSDSSNTVGDSNLDATTNGSHVGLKASVKEGQYTATVVYERGLGNDDTTTSSADGVRQSYLAVSSPIGTVTYGRAASEYKKAGQKHDPFFNTGISTINGGAVATSSAVVTGPSYGLSALTSEGVGNGFLDNTLAYTSPSFGGLTVNAGFFAADSAAGVNEDHDYALGVNWAAGGLEAGVQYLDINGAGTVTAAGLPGNTQALRFHAGYTQKNWGVGASYEKLEIAAAADRDYALASGWFGLSDKTRLAASYGYTDNTPFEGSSISVGVFHGVMSNLDIYLAAQSTDRKSSNAGANANDATAVSVGLNFDFGMKVGK